MFESIRNALSYPIYRSPYSRRLETRVQELWRVVDILSATSAEDDNDVGNTYKEKSTYVDEIYSKYQNLSTWGCQFVQRIINHNLRIG